MTTKILTMCAVAVLAAGCASQSEEMFMLVGTYTGTGSEGIYSYKFNQDTGEASLVSTFPMENPSFLISAADGKSVYSVYSVIENSDSTSSVVSFSFKDGMLEQTAKFPSMGEAPCHVSTNGDKVLISNYMGGNLSVYPILADGSIDSSEAVFSGSMGGPDLGRQEAPHVHCSAFTPDGKYIFVSDFSADRLMRLEIEGDKVINSGVTFPVHSDYGPRHLQFDASGKNFYVLGELSGDVTVFGYEDGQLTEKQVVDADPGAGRGAADIRISPDGKFLYASCRLVDDGISIFKILPDGTLEYAGYCLTGTHPRNFNITPNGKYLLCACRDTDEIQIFARDMKSGLLEYTGRSIDVPRPVCIEWIVSMTGKGGVAD